MLESATADWLRACDRAAGAIAEHLDATPMAERLIETGALGEGGDRTLRIDEHAEQVVFAQLEALHNAGHRFTACSEERGSVDFGSDALMVIVDPIDGSLNAKRGLPHHCLSIAVADGPTAADVFIGYVYDFGPNERWTAVRGGGATCDGRTLDPAVGERRHANGRLEVIGIESADPRVIAAKADALKDLSYRVRAIGAIAVTLCQVAGARLDGMVTLKRSRAVDSAAGQLIVRESGGVVAFPEFDEPLGAPLDLVAHSPVIAARTERALEQLREVTRA